MSHPNPLGTRALSVCSFGLNGREALLLHSLVEISSLGDRGYTLVEDFRRADVVVVDFDDAEAQARWQRAATAHGAGPVLGVCSGDPALLPDGVTRLPRPLTVRTMRRALEAVANNGSATVPSTAVAARTDAPVAAPGTQVGAAEERAHPESAVDPLAALIKRATAGSVPRVLGVGLQDDVRSALRDYALLQGWDLVCVEDVELALERMSTSQGPSAIDLAVVDAWPDTESAFRACRIMRAEAFGMPIAVIGGSVTTPLTRQMQLKARLAGASALVARSTIDGLLTGAMASVRVR